MNKQKSIIKKETDKWERIKPVVVNGLKVLAVTGIGAGAVAAIRKVGKWLESPSDFKSWLETMSDKDLEEAYEKRRLENHGNVTNDMALIDSEIVKRMNEKYEREHPNSIPRYREHGWYLPSD